MASESIPVRFQVSGAGLSRGFAACDLEVPRNPLLAALPGPTKALPRALMGEEGTIAPAARACFAILADPLLDLKLQHWPANSVAALETRFLAAADGNGAVRYLQLARPSEDLWDFALLGNSDAALSVVLALVGRDRVAGSGNSLALPPEGLRLGMPALAVVGVLAGYFREARLLRIYLADQARRPALVLRLAPEQIGNALKAQMQRPDLNSPLARLVLATDGALLESIDAHRLEPAFAELRSLGVLCDDYTPSEFGFGLIAQLAQGYSLTVLQAARRIGGESRVETLVVHDGAAGRLVGMPMADGKGRIETLHIVQASDEACHHLLSALLACSDN